MKLTLNRREEQKKGLFKTSTAYFLDINLEATPEEKALIKKHLWDKMRLYETEDRDGTMFQWKMDYFVGQPRSMQFQSVEELAYVENQVIENAKKLKQQLETVAGFTSGGPREVEL